MKKKSKKRENASEHLELKGFLSFLILHELSLKRLCGDELSANIGKRRGTSLTPGTIYPALKRLRKKKLIAYRRQGRKKVYSLTELGEKELEKLYTLFSAYFYGLKHKIMRKPDKARTEKKKK
ncbi:PadR family transcriptional regulator [Candidatus Woesearchaeota archaeon]|nr:PadR family transcriptional regulator [Candidatus Woesearchaeota archaeon]